MEFIFHNSYITLELAVWIQSFTHRLLNNMRQATCLKNEVLKFQ